MFFVYLEAGQRKFDFLQNLALHYALLSKTFVPNYIFQTFLGFTRATPHINKNLPWEKQKAFQSFLAFQVCTAKDTPLPERGVRKNHASSFPLSLRQWSKTKLKWELGPWASLCTWTWPTESTGELREGAPWNSPGNKTPPGGQCSRVACWSKKPGRSNCKTDVGTSGKSSEPIGKKGASKTLSPLQRWACAHSLSSALYSF